MVKVKKKKKAAVPAVVASEPPLKKIKKKLKVKRKPVETDTSAQVSKIVVNEKASKKVEKNGVQKFKRKASALIPKISHLKESEITAHDAIPGAPEKKLKRQIVVPPESAAKAVRPDSPKHLVVRAPAVAPLATSPAKPKQAPAKQTNPRPRSEKEYIERLVEHLEKEGPTPLRKLGSAVPRMLNAPPRCLKTTLAKRKWQFIVDVHGVVDISRAKRWHWRWHWRTVHAVYNK